MLLVSKPKAMGIDSFDATTYRNGLASKTSIESSKSHLLDSRSSRSISSVG
jgi:hypothetical protein